MNDLVQRIYAAFDPSPLKADNGGLYVELDDVRGEADIVKRTSVKIRLADGEPTCQVLAGHKGSGKSTELNRLQRELETGDQKMFVVFCDADDDIDRNDVDFRDLLVAIIRQMSSQLKERAQITLKPGYFRDRLQAIVTHGLPVNHKSLARALREGRQEYARQLRAEHWPLLESVRTTGTLARTAENEMLFRDLLESRAILQYVNDDEWYGLNPMVAAVKNPVPPTEGAA